MVSFSYKHSETPCPHRLQQKPVNTGQLGHLGGHKVVMKQDLVRSRAGCSEPASAKIRSIVYTYVASIDIYLALS